MKRSSDYHRSSTTSSNKSTKKRKPHNSPSVQIKEEIVDQSDETRSNNQSSASASSKEHINQQASIKKEELADDYETKHNLIKCEFKKEEIKSECKSECKSESLLPNHSIVIKRECIKHELTEEDCGCNECIPFHPAQLNVQQNQNGDSSEQDNDDNDSNGSVNKNPQPSTSAEPTLTEHCNEDDSNQGATINTNHNTIRRSNRPTAEPRSSYVSQYIESSDSEDSNFESREASNSDESESDESSKPLSKTNPRNKKPKNRIESSGNESELEEDEDENETEEHEPNRQLKEKSPKRWITIVHLKCSVCNQKVKNAFELKLHQLTEHQIRQFRCPVNDCCVSFEYCEQVQEHRLTDHGDLTIWACRECSIEMLDYKGLNHHIWEFHQAGHFKCAHNGCKFESHTTRSVLFNHFKDHLPKFCCTFDNCDKSYNCKADLVLHVRLIHTGEKAFACKDCSKSFATLKRLNKHVRATHEDYKPYRCKWPKCQYSCSYAGNITKHVRFHLRKAGDSNRDPNEFVERKFRRQPQTQNKKDKNKVVAKEEDPNDEKGITRIITLRLDCPVEQCPVFMVNKTELNQHLLQSHQIDQHRCLLSDCTASFKYLMQLTAHRRNDHKDLDRYECPKCHNYSSTDYKKLIAHNYLQHEMGHFQCAHDGCDFVSTTNRQKVDGHLYTHVELKFKCTFDGCAYAAKDKRLLEAHLKRHQPKVMKRYDCTKCCRFFPRLSDLVRHEKSHLKDGYRCQWKGCDYFAGDTMRIKLHLCEDHKVLEKQASNQWHKKLCKYWKKVFV